MSYTNGLDNPSLYFNTKLYTGTGATNSQTVGFQPDWVWIKSRSTAANSGLMDSVRGNTKLLTSNSTNAEATYTDELTAFTSTGITLGASINGFTNYSGNSYVAWNWLASNSTASNTDGDITSTVSANTTSGFSVVTYDGPASGSGNKTIGHGLGVAPSVIIVKARNATYAWDFYHKSLGYNASLVLNSDQNTRSGAFGAEPTSTVYTATYNYTWEPNIDYVAYCFAEKKGFSKFGSYTGNGSADGTFVYTGFKPAWFLVKESSASGNNWYIWDNKRDDNGNPMEEYLIPNLSNAEGGSGNDYLDFVSNGIKTRNSNTAFNNSGSTYIYMAFASNPFVTSGGIPTTAR